jgi:hypothetical protein
MLRSFPALRPNKFRRLRSFLPLIPFNAVVTVALLESLTIADSAWESELPVLILPAFTAAPIADVYSEMRPV